ncbi:MAG: hypothetical protein VB139_04565 [Coriobacteriia bacterium]|nr:hypothetical protein [Coriobacteriia bacterium]
MELFGMLIGVSAATLTLAVVLVSLAAPFLWLWMVIDAALREEWEYPEATAASNNRLLWVLLMIFVQIAAIPYYFVVFAKVRRGSVPRPSWACAPTDTAMAQPA